MTYVIDTVALLIVFLFVYRKARQGFVKTVVATVGMIVAAVAAVLLSQYLAPFVYDRLISPHIQQQISEFVMGNCSAEQLAQGLFKNRLFSAGFSTAGWTQETLTQKLNETVLSSVESSAQTLIPQILRPVAVELLQTVVFVFSLAFLIFALRFAARAINKLISITPASRLNTFFGGVLGALEGVVIVAALFSVLVLLQNLYPGFLGLDQQNLKQTFIYRIIYSVF